MNKHMDRFKALKAQSVSAFSDFKREVCSSLFVSTQHSDDHGNYINIGMTCERSI